MKISPLDYSTAQNWTGSSSSGQLLSTSGNQSSSAPNLSHTFTNDGGEHFFYILYRKDSSVNSGADRGYIAFRESNYVFSPTETVDISYESQSLNIQIQSDTDWTISNSYSWIQIDKSCGSYNDTINLTVEFNAGSTRQGFITLRTSKQSYTITITQSPYQISAPTQIIITTSVKTVPINALLGFTVDNPNDWIELSSSSDSISIRALSNVTNGVRKGVITIYSGGTSQSITVMQGIPDGCIFWLPLNNIDATTDLVNGHTLEIVQGSDVKFDQGDQMYEFKQSYSAAARIRIPFTSSTFPNNAFTIMCKLKVLSQNMVSEHYLRSFTLKSPNFTSSSSTAFQVLYVPGGSGDVHIFPTYACYASSRISANSRIFNFNSSTQQFASYQPHLPSQWISSYDGYLYFGGAADYKHLDVSYRISDVMIFNKILTDDEISELQQ